MKKNFLDEEYNPKGYVPFLDKRDVEQKTITEIVNVTPGNRPDRPLIHGHFDWGVRKFDLTLKEMQKLVSAYGKVMRDWIGQRIEIQSKFYKDSKGRTGLTLVIIPL